MIKHASDSGMPDPDPVVRSTGSSQSSSGLSLRPVGPEDAEAVHDLLVASIPDVLADRSRWLARWRWQYWDNPYREDRAAGWVLADGDRIVGHLGAVHIPLRVDEERVSGVIGADYAVADDAITRGGMFAGLQLAEAFFTAARGGVALATTANENTGAVFARFGCRPVAWTREFWRAPATLAQQIRVCCGATSRVARALLRGRAGPVVSGVLGWYCRRFDHRPAVPIPPGCHLETTVPQLAGDLGWIWEGFAWSVADAGFALPDEVQTGRRSAGVGQVEGSGLSSIDRCQVYLEWRYSRHPERENIRVLVVRDRDGQPTGAAVVFFDERGGRLTAFIEELIVLPDRMDVARTLLCAAVRLACDHEADRVVTTPGRRAIRHLFWELGFECRARSAPAVVIQLPGGPAAEKLDGHLNFWHGEMF